MLKQAKLLYDLGLHLHWLRPKSKAPIDNGWQKQKRKSFEELEKQYRPGFGLGVRLGEKLGPGYLSVIDCDVKSKKSTHLDEMDQKLDGIFNDSVGHAAVVLSGRGNGSSHYYILTQHPVKPYRYARSKDVVKVEMPSVEPNKIELGTLSTTEIKQGIRLRPAWEISIMGVGQQVVLPPTIHPDSGKPYRWERPFNLSNATILNIDRPESNVTYGGAINDFKAETVDLLSLGLPDGLIDLIISGSECHDRSEALLRVASELFNYGLTQNQILSVLTDNDYYLGETAFDHAGHTRSRLKAANWLNKYVLGPVVSERENLFVEGEDNLKCENVELVPNPKTDWMKKLERTSKKEGAPLKLSLVNMIKILKGELGESFVSHDEFSLNDTFLTETSWGIKKGKHVTDIDILIIKRFMAEKYKLEYSKERISECVQMIAFEKRYHPVKDYLNSLEWDGKPRLDNWLFTYLGAKGPKEYIQAVGRKTIVAMVKRIFEPGCDFHYVLILQGKQRLGKSETAKILAGPWFSDTAIDVRDKDGKLALLGIWVMELAELATFYKSESRAMKNFIAVAADRVRRPYGKATEMFKRQSIFMGTTNDESFLSDSTGNERYWPVEVTALKKKELERDRDQLFAEAIAYYLNGEEIKRLEGAVLEQARAVQESKLITDDTESIIEEFFKNNNDNFMVNEKHFRICDIVSNVKIPGNKNPRDIEMRVGVALKNLGYEKAQKRVDGIRAVWWSKKVSTPVNTSGRY